MTADNDTLGTDVCLIERSRVRELILSLRGSASLVCGQLLAEIDALPITALPIRAVAEPDPLLPRVVHAIETATREAQDRGNYPPAHIARAVIELFAPKSPDGATPAAAIESAIHGNYPNGPRSITRAVLALLPSG